METDFLRDGGLEELADAPERIDGGLPAGQLGTAQGTILRDVAVELGLPQDAVVAVGAIDAHAGAVAALAHANGDLNSCAALILGTSACLMALSKDERIIPNAWCAHKDVVYENFFLTETGISACGSAIDDVLSQHPYFEEANRAVANSQYGSIFDFLNAQVVSGKVSSRAPLFVDGNRLAPEPVFDAKNKSSATNTLDDLLQRYVSVVEGLCVSLCHCVAVLNEHGFALSTLVVSGSVAKNDFFCQTLANACQSRVLRVCSVNQMVLGSAMMARAAVERKSLPEIVGEMRSPVDETFKPRENESARFRKLLDQFVSSLSSCSATNVQQNV